MFITLTAEPCAGWTRRLWIVMVFVLVATLSEVPMRPVRPAAAAVSKPASKPACPTDRPDEVSAAIAARLCGSRVEVAGRRTETTQVFANADGTLTEEQALAPVRVRAGDRWVPVDLTLRRQADGSIAPVAHPRGLTFAGATAGGGEHEVASIGTGADRSGLAWTGALPEPVLDGRTITYPDVRPGVDLVFHAHATGYEQHVVVKDRAGLAQVRKLSLPLRTGKLTAVRDGMGGLVLKNGKGRQVGRAQTPLMWDAEVAPLSGERVNHAPVGLRTVAGGTGRTVLELTPDPAFLARTDLAFPVTIDPPTSLSASFDAFVQNSYSSDQSGSADLKLGYSNDGGSFTARSYLRFNTTGFAGSRIMSAKLRLWNYHSWSCTAASWEAWRTDYVDSSVRWTDQPTARAKVGTSTETRGYSSSCGDGYVYVEVGGALQYAADTSASSASVMLRATSETSTAGWKRFDSAEGTHPPLVSITYNSAPSAPSALAVAPCYTVCGSGAQTSSLRPTVSAKLADANAGQTLQAEFSVRNKTTLAVVSSSGLRSGSPAWTNGSTASWQVPVDLTNGTQYEWQVRGKDPYAYGAWTAWTPLTVDTSPPGVPFVAATIYLNDAQPHGGAGQADTFTFTPASGSTDLAAFVYKFDYDSAATTLAATGAKSVTLSPRDGHRTLTVQAKDSAGNLSSPNLYVFDAGNAALAEPLPGATIVKRTKLRITTPVAGYTRAYYEYRRGPGGATLPVPSANLTSATGAPITATATAPVGLSTLGGYAIWNATDTLGLIGGVVEVRAHLYTATGTTPAYTVPWVRANVDSSGNGAARDDVGPGSVNLLTGDYSLSSTDVDQLSLSVSRSSASRDPADGYQRMAEVLDGNQQQVSTDLSGFTVAATSSAIRSTARGQGETTPLDSLEITPVTTTSNDTYVAVGGDGGALRLGMAPGKTYRMTGWIYVPGATGLLPAHTQRGLRIVGLYKVGTVYTEVTSAMAGYTDGWQELSVDLTVPAGATEAFFRLYNGMQGGSGRKVYWDNLSFTEIVAPFGPSWTGGATGGAAGVAYTTLTTPEPSLVEVTTADGGWITFAKNSDGVSFTPEPGAEVLTLKKVSGTAYRLSDQDGSITEFTAQGGVWAATSTWNGEANTTSRLVYDTTGNRLLLKKVVNPVEPGVDDTNNCVAATPARGCEVLEYEYATATTSGLSQTVFGDYTDRVAAVKLWAWNPVTATVTATVVARYAYDNLGQLREVWDPRISPALKTAYEYAGGRVTKVTPPGQLPWNVDYGNPDVDSAALRWDLDAGSGTAVADSSGGGRTGTMATGVTWGRGNDPANPADRAAVFTGGAGQQISVAGTALSNTSSYTVAAWVRIKDKSVNRTAVSKDGTSTSGFFLNYVAAEDKFAFSRVTSDSESATPVRATANTTAVAGQWTHLAGVYDTSASKMRLYVNGVLQNTTAATGGWNASGNYVIGRAKWAGAAANIWDGEIDDVRVYGKALTDDQVTDLAGDENAGRLLRVRRAGLQQGSKTVVDGETAANVVYNVPLTKSAGGPHDLNAAAISTWGQVDLPTDATAIFGPEDNPNRNSATPAAPGTNGYPYALVHYLGAGGKETNTATPGNHIDTQEYDRFGNPVRTLEATNRELALGILPGAAGYLEELGLANSDTASRALALSTVRTYSTDGIDLVDTLGPTSTVVLKSGAPDPDGTGPLEAMPAGATVIGRHHVTTTYDEGKPDGATYHLATTEKKGVQIVGYADADVQVARNGYDSVGGGASGWTLHKPTTRVTDAGTGGANLTSTTVYDTAGRVVKTSGIDSTGTDARAQQTIYYTAGVNGQDSACGNRPEWAGNECVTSTVGSVTGHDPDRMTSALPVGRVVSYDTFGGQAQFTDGVGSQTRTIVTAYDAAGRPVGKTVTASQGVAVDQVTTGYSPTTGAVTTTTMGSASIVRDYDSLGRLVSYTDADGGTTTTEFDRLGKTVKIADPTGHTTYAYNRAAEPRGMATSITDSIAGTFSATYSPDGHLTQMTYPGGITRADRQDANLEATERTYTRDSDGTVIYAESVVENSHGQWTTHSYTGGSKNYRYDRLGRVTRVQHHTSMTEGCVTRTYAYDNRANRTSNSRFAPATDGSCDEGSPTEQLTHTYDTADRLTDAGYTYDAFGRTTATPDGLANTYYVNDLVQGQQLDDARQTWTLDPMQRSRAFTAETQVDGTWTTSSTRTNHYGNDSDAPRWIVEDAASGSVARNVPGPDGDLAAVTSGTGDVRLALTNLHGDISVTIDTALVEPEFFDYEEFGAPVVGQADQRYGWLGGKQRSAEALGGVVLMGVRLYSPALGRFLQVDPVPGGSCNPYDYVCADPANETDLSGKCPPCAVAAIAADVIVAVLLLALIYAVARCVITGCGIAPAIRSIPWPSIHAPSVKRFRLKRYIVYQISYFKGGSWRTWKYGISRVGTSRPSGQLTQCRTSMRASCRYVVRNRVTGWFAARSLEAGYITAYYMRHGHCPPGQYYSCR
ncbi:LamG-like jellyroll fold domain-containing protein [Micromonospora sp. NPDC092111]|uniref:LamG-like jellyroll fold domain-containing protein n=1 Tax=Micromonospora sp. NPDC092111 TaxID=3364289 RepID=UPI0038006BBC